MLGRGFFQIALFVTISVLFTTPSYPFPYWSYSYADAPYYWDKFGPSPVQSPASKSGPGTTSAVDPYCPPAGVCHFYEADAGGLALAYADPKTSTLKVFSSYFHTGVQVTWTVCFFGFCYLSEPYDFGSFSRSYTRSVWEVTSDTLGVGTPVQMQLSISLSGKFSDLGYDGLTDGYAAVRMNAWLYTPQIAASVLQENLADVMDSLYKDTYLPVYMWWQDMGFLPTLSIYTRYTGGPKNFSDTVTMNFPITADTGIHNVDGSLPLLCEHAMNFPITPDPGIPPYSFLNEIKVGDTLILELELWAMTVLTNADDGSLTFLKADFYDTGTAGFNILTEGVYLKPASAPVPIPSTLLLLGPAFAGFALLRRWKKIFSK